MLNIVILMWKLLFSIINSPRHFANVWSTVGLTGEVGSEETPSLCAETWFGLPQLAGRQTMVIDNKANASSYRYLRG